MDIINQLDQTEQEVLRFFALDEADMGRSYSPGKWTIRELLVHLSDAEAVLLERIKRGIAKPGQVVYGFDQDAWASGLNYKNRNMANAKVLFQATRRAIKELAENFFESHGSNTYVHSETGKRTVKEEFEKVVWHAQHHLEQMGVALGTC